MKIQNSYLNIPAQKDDNWIVKTHTGKQQAYKKITYQTYNIRQGIRVHCNQIVTCIIF